MGCDCTAHFEVKINNKWEHYSVPNIHRNYLLFEKMAGVRGSVENALAPPKGLPDDISNITRIDSEQWGIDGHHHSWLSSEEFKKLHQYHQELYGRDWWHIDYEQYGYLFGNEFHRFKSGVGEYPEEIQDFRLVFWFDN